MIRSLRWRMQIWFTGLLLAVVGTFGGVLVYQAWRTQTREVDAQLAGGARYLELNLRAFPPFEIEGREPPPRPRPPGGGPKPGPKHGPGPPPHNSKERRFDDLALPRELVSTRGGPSHDHFYYGVWRPDGTILKGQGIPHDAEGLDASELSPRPEVRSRGPFREAWMRGPHGTTILVGRGVMRERNELWTFAWQLAIIGLVVVAAGAAMVFVLARRMVRPLGAMAASAGAISETNLGERLDTVEMDEELASLAEVLNETFRRLESAFSRQTQFTADASHELRTPLAILRSQAELALSRPRTSEEYRQTLDVILRAAARMGHLVQGLLTLARADGNHLELRKAVVRLDEAATDAIELLRSRAEEKNLRLTAELAVECVLGDGESLGRVIVNLLENAIQYTPAAGSVHVRVAASGERTRLTVSDNGPGIPVADQPRVFERFFRVDKARSRASGGAGLGLAICRTIVEAHGGEIGLDSVEGQGCRFWIELARARRG